MKKKNWLCARRW